MRFPLLINHYCFMYYLCISYAVPPTCMYLIYIDLSCTVVVSVLWKGALGLKAFPANKIPESQIPNPTTADMVDIYSTLIGCTCVKLQLLSIYKVNLDLKHYNTALLWTTWKALPSVRYMAIRSQLKG